jgi:sugar fermentation stimulation protein A
MRFEQPLIEGTLLRRHKRFLADVKLNNGDEITVHCANPGSMMGCSEPGSKVLISQTVDPRRKFKHQLEIIYAGRTPVGIHTGRPVTVVGEAIMEARIPELAGYAQLRRDAKYGRDNRIDLLLEGNGLRNCYIEVINVTLADDNVAYYPDVVMPEGPAHLDELTDLVREGNRAMLFFVAQRADVTKFRPADHLDPEFSQALRDAIARGVEPMCWRSRVTRKGIELDEQMLIELGS